jgi:hypothetical protein
MNKFKPHKACSCRACKRGKRTKSGKEDLHINERVFRRRTKQQLNKDPEEFTSGPISQPYTD